MERFIAASARGRSAAILTDKCLAQLGAVPAEANLGFIYATDALEGELHGLLMRLRQHLPTVRWVGSVGVGVCTTAQEYYDEPALALLVGSFDPDAFHLVPSQDTSSATWPHALRTVWEGHAGGVALLHADPTDSGLPAILGEIAIAASGLFLNGGLTSSAAHHYQVCDTVVNGSLSGVLFDPSVAIVTDHTQGCSPIGPPHTVTAAHRNIALRLDDRPAVDVMKEEIGDVLARDLHQVAGYIFVALPIEGSDTGDYLVRNLIGLDEGRGVLAVGDYLDAGRRLMFCRRDGNSARADLNRMLARLKKRIGSRPIRGGIYVSCLGRGRHQFGDNSEELRMIADALGEFPLAGFFANGEIYNGRLYGYTGVLTLFL